VRHKWTKHIELDIHFIWEKVSLREVHVLHVPSSRQFADVFTKGLSSALFTVFRDSLFASSIDAESTGGGGGCSTVSAVGLQRPPVHDARPRRVPTLQRLRRRLAPRQDSLATPCTALPEDSLSAPTQATDWHPLYTIYVIVCT
jgi:hypothetical protein